MTSSSILSGFENAYFCKNSIDTPSANAFVILDGYQRDGALPQLTFGHMLERLGAWVAL